MANYTEHSASVVVKAPVHQVYSLFSHFNDFPKFMSFVKEVTYKDEANSHWVADVAGRHEWDAVNDMWIEDRQISWHSTEGLNNFGKVTFDARGPDETKVDVSISYEPPAGFLGEMGEKLGVGSHFDAALQNDLNHFARMVGQAPSGGLDPNSSNYLFHEDSAAAKGTTTNRQNETMYNDASENQGGVVYNGPEKDYTGPENQGGIEYSGPERQGAPMDNRQMEQNKPAGSWQAGTGSEPMEQGKPAYHEPERQDRPMYNEPERQEPARQDRPMYNEPARQDRPVYNEPERQSGTVYSAPEGQSEPTNPPGESNRPILDRDITGITNRDLFNKEGTDTTAP